MIVFGGNGNTGGRYNPVSDSWTAVRTTNAPGARSGHVAVWTGSEMIVWGGVGDFASYVNTGGRYNPATDSWAATYTFNAIGPRVDHTAVWTGIEMIVWGGWYNPGFSNVLWNTGGRYNPATNSWIVTSTTNAPVARRWHSGTWTGNEMIVWGGEGTTGNRLNTGGRYDPTTDSWTATDITGINYLGRRHR
jgi:N-acetylneuraminic acid mutarotase